MDQHRFCPKGCKTLRHRWALFDSYDDFLQAEQEKRDHWNESARRYQECWHAQSADDHDRRWPWFVLSRLRGVTGLQELGKGEVIRCWQQTVAAYQGGLIARHDMESARLGFLDDANALIDFAEFLQTGRPKRPRNPSERRLRTKWLAIERPRQARNERHRQRRLLRQGHETMKNIRLVLRGQDPLPPLASVPVKSSPIS